MGLRTFQALGFCCTERTFEQKAPSITRHTYFLKFHWDQGQANQLASWYESTEVTSQRTPCCDVAFARWFETAYFQSAVKALK
jgi:hypothetical protein